MANSLVASSNTASGSSSSTLAVSHPSGLTAGDEMCLIVGWHDIGGGTNRTITTPSGWTSRQSVSQDLTGMQLFTKTATAGDVSAGTTTLTFSGAYSEARASILRITGAPTGSLIAGTEIDTDTGPTDNTPDYTTAITPTTAESLIVIGFIATRTTLTGTAPTISNYRATPTVTFTEYADLGTGGGGSSSMAFGVAAAPYDGTSQFTNRGCDITADQTMNREGHSVAIVYNSIQDGLGTNEFISVSPAFFAPTASADTSGTNALHTATPEFFSQSGKVKPETQWQNETKPATNWQNETL
jgi:hypothetical protein